MVGKITSGEGKGILEVYGSSSWVLGQPVGVTSLHFSLPLSLSFPSPQFLWSLLRVSNRSVHLQHMRPGQFITHPPSLVTSSAIKVMLACPWASYPILCLHSSSTTSLTLPSPQGASSLMFMSTSGWISGVSLYAVPRDFWKGVVIHVSLGVYQREEKEGLTYTALQLTSL